MSNVVTKRDFKLLETEIAHVRKDIEVLRSETKQGIAETKAELIRWVVSVGLLQSALIVGVLLKVAHLV